MKRFPLNLGWYLAAVLVVDIPPVLIFFLMHRFNMMGGLAPQIIATVLFLALLCGQALLHLHILNRRFPAQVDKNVWSMLAVSFLVFSTFWVFTIGLIIWATTAITQT